MMSNDAKPADSESDIDTDSLSDTVGKQPALAEKIEGATKDSLATNSDQLPEDTTSANGEDEKPKLAMLPPPVRKARPPVPAFSSQSGAAAQKPPGEEAQRTDEGSRARAAALAAARRAASMAAPAQREKAVAQAAAAAAAAYSMARQLSKEAAASLELPMLPSAPKLAAPEEPSKSMPSYAEPDWAGAPKPEQFKMETMKNGQIIEQQDLEKSCFKFGRAPGCDVLLEHPSISRLHAVIQFRGSDGMPSLFDAGSVHGSFINKKRVKPRVYAPLNVGDILKFGQSSRLFIIGGPAELMPEEGLSRSQRHHLRALEAKEKRKLREQEVAKAQMSAALNKGISWGMGGEDASVDMDDDSGAPSVDWRAYSQTHSLTDHQQKMADKLRRLENRIRNLSSEIEKIKAKQGKMEEMTAGQATTMSRNEQVIDSATEEMEDLEEELNGSIAASLRGKRNKMLPEASKKRRKVEEEDEVDSEEEDEFYDRTTTGPGKKQKVAPLVHDAASLFGRKEALMEERGRLQQKLLDEEEGAGAGGKVGSEGKAVEEVQEDPLDAFMSNVTVQLEQSKVMGLRKEVAEVDAEVRKLEDLLKHADPDGYYREGTHAARVAKEKGLRLFNKDREEKSALEKKKRQEAALKEAEKAAKALFVPETEDEAEAGVEPAAEAAEKAETASQRASAAQAAELAMVHRLTEQDNQSGGLEIRKSLGPSKLPPVVAMAPSQQPLEYGLNEGPTSKQKRDAMIMAQLAKEKAPLKPAVIAPVAHGEDQIMADMALLKTASRLEEDGGIHPKNKVIVEGGDWEAPKGQTGDGRTALNAKFGY